MKAEGKKLHEAKQYNLGDLEKRGSEVQQGL